MNAKKVRKIEKLADGGLLVELSDGTTARYETANALPSDLVGLLGRMDAAGDGEAAQGDAEASRARYLARLEQAHQQQGQATDPDTGLSGRQLYEARLRDAWAQPLAEKRPARKHWSGS